MGNCKASSPGPNTAWTRRLNVEHRVDAAAKRRGTAWTRRLNSLRRVSDKLLRPEPPAGEVEEDGGGETDRVDAVQHAAVAFDQRAVVLHAAVAFDGRHGDAAGEAHQGDHGRHHGRHPPIDAAEGRGPPQHGADEHDAGRAAQQPFPRSRGVDRGHDHVLVGKLRPGVLEGVAELHDQHEEEQQPRAAAGVLVGQLERQQRRRVAEAVDADQQPALNLRRPLQEPLVVAGHGDARGNQQEGVDRNHDAVPSVVSHSHQPELQRRNEEEHPEQGAMVAGPRGRQRDELAQGPERKQPEEHDRGPVSQKKRRRQRGEQDPPGADAERGTFRGWRRRCRFPGAASAP